MELPSLIPKQEDRNNPLRMRRLLLLPRRMVSAAKEPPAKAVATCFVSVGGSCKAHCWWSGACWPEDCWAFGLGLAGVWTPSSQRTAITAPNVPSRISRRNHCNRKSHPTSKAPRTTGRRLMAQQLRRQTPVCGSKPRPTAFGRLRRINSSPSKDRFGMRS